MRDVGTRIDGQADRERRSSFFRTVHDHAAAMAFGHVAHVGQAQSPALDLDVLDPLEGMEEPLHLGVRDRRALVVYGDQHARIGGADPHRDRTRRVAVFPGVRHEVLEDALERDAAPVSFDPVAFDLDLLPEQGNVGADFLDQGHDVEVHDMQLQLHLPFQDGCVQQRLDHGIGFRDLQADLLRQRQDAWIARLQLDQLGGGVRHVQGIAQVVRQAGNEGFADFLVDRVVAADRLARRFLDRMPDDLGIALAQRKATRRGYRKQDFAEDLQLMDEVVRAIVGHVGPLPTVRNGQVGPGRRERPRRTHRQGLCDVVVQGGEGIDQDRLAECHRRRNLGGHARAPLRQDDIAQLQESRGECGHRRTATACVARIHIGFVPPVC